MLISWTSSALQKIQKILPPSDEYIKLAYDSEGCGCVVSGVPQLWLVSQQDPYDVTADGPLAMLYDKRHEIFFEEELRIDYNPDKKTYSLKSNNQIYSAYMPIIDKRKANSI